MLMRFLWAIPLMAMFLLSTPAKVEASNNWIYADIDCEFRFQLPEAPEKKEKIVQTSNGPQKVTLYWYEKEMSGGGLEAKIGIQAYCYKDHPVQLMRMEQDDLIKKLEENAHGREFLHKETYYKEFEDADYRQATLTGFLRITEETPLIHLSNIYVGRDSVMVISGDIIGDETPLSDVFREIMDSAHKPHFD